MRPRCDWWVVAWPNDLDRRCKLKGREEQWRWEGGEGRTRGGERSVGEQGHQTEQRRKHEGGEEEAGGRGEEPRKGKKEPQGGKRSSH